MADQQVMDSGGIQGQLSQISMELGRQSTQLAVITTKLDSLTAGMGDHENRIRSVENSLPPNLDARLSALETAKAKIIGAGVSSGVLSGGIATLLYWVLSAHH